MSEDHSNSSWVFDPRSLDPHTDYFFDPRPPDPLPYVVRGSALERALAARVGAGMDLPDLTLTPTERDALRSRLSVLTHIHTTKGVEPTDSLLADLGVHDAVGRGTRARYAATDKLAADIRHQLYGDTEPREAVPTTLKLSAIVLAGGAAFLMVNIPAGIALMVAGVVMATIGIIGILNRPPRETVITHADLESGIGHVAPDRATADLARRVSELPALYTGHDAHDSIAEWSREALMSLGQIAADQHALDALPGHLSGDEDSERRQLYGALDGQLADIERDYHDRAEALSKTQLDLARMNHPSVIAQHEEKP